MSNFLKAKKYYTKKELDEYVGNLMTNTEITLMEQRERILDLKEEVARLTDELENKRKSEKDDKKALQASQKKCEELEKETKEKCAKEILSVKQFAVGWYDKFDEIVKKYGISESDLPDKLIVEVGAMSSQYSTPCGSNIDERFNKLLERVKEKRKLEAASLADAGDLGFSIEEALHPVDSLDDILKDLL